jgi:heme A synthase
MIDLPALLAIAALGWGLSLCTYRYFARKNGWTMGSLHADLPAVPTIIGLFAIFVALAFASWRGTPEGGWIVVLFGVLLAFFWTGFLRVGSQVTLFLAPIATAFLIFVWLSLDPTFDRADLVMPALVSVFS